MHLSIEQIADVARWWAELSKRKRPDLAEIQNLLGLGNGSLARDDYALDGHFSYPVDSANFDPDDIEEELEPSRYEALTGGQKPTAEELRLWTQKKNSQVFDGDNGWYHFYLWKIDLPEGPIYFRSFHGDGGILDSFHGPFKSEEQALADAGNLERNPRP